MTKYKLECTQADGSIWTVPHIPMCYKDAQELKKDYSSVFTKCKWRVIKL